MEKKLKLLNEEAQNKDASTRERTRSNAMKGLFIARIAGLIAELNSNMPLLVKPVVEANKKLLKAISKFETELEPYKLPAMKWLYKPLDRSLAYSVSAIIETVSQLTTESDEEIYEKLTQIVHTLISEKKKKSKLNFHKYMLLLELIDQELSREIANEPCIISSVDNSLLFNFPEDVPNKKVTP